MQLPRQCQYCMKLLACIGSKCDASTLKFVVAKSRDVEGEVDGQMLDFAVDEGLLKKEGSNYVFVHDQIQQAAHSLIPEHELGCLHRQIGYLILKHATENEVNDLLFTAVSQLNRGIQHSEKEDERLDLQKLNLKAGEKAMSMAAFTIAASYLKSGIDMFLDSHWEQHYD
eukprot:1693249-Ditylum_brightwellii.AAC.1